MIVKFDKWAPDQAPFNTGSVALQNVIYFNQGYEQMPYPTKINPDGFGGGTPLKLFVGKPSLDISIPICLGSTGSQRASATSWVDLGGSFLNSDSWEINPYGDVVYCVNGRDPIQKINLLSGSNFQPLAVPNGLTSRFIAQVADFNFLADIREQLGNTIYPFRAQWSGIQRPEIFTPDPAIQSDFQDVADIGKLTGLTGGEFGLILGQNGLSRVDYFGGDIIFKFTTLENDVGCDIPNSVIRTDARTYWHSKRGFRMSSGDVSEPIGRGQVDNWFDRNCKKDAINRMSAIALPKFRIILWSFVSIFSPDGEPDYILAYNYSDKAWTYGNYRVGVLGFSATSTAFTDDEAIPLPGFNFNTSRTDDFNQLTDLYEDDSSFPAAIVDKSLAALQQGANIESYVETKELQLNPNGLTRLNKFLPLIHAVSGSIKATVKVRDIQGNENYRMYTNLAPEPSGIISNGSNGRYHTIRITMQGPFNKGIGIDIVEAVATGGR